ncbi:hypothetical protein NP233_g13070 [Leucocoprinus birnbaumii]|uniref:CxC2-like cysteine cluster KDZ transposase-associated domain-containing protein n=1 Tax=Leucocoprinus birnbaumii TaxID=56174 RepID=A0AAD5VFQ8_9AGAR|nr:hypothetical protein NP233_g13070 [Leucocoprinus birnbaumii]
MLCARALSVLSLAGMANPSLNAGGSNKRKRAPESSRMIEGDDRSSDIVTWAHTPAQGRSRVAILLPPIPSSSGQGQPAQSTRDISPAHLSQETLNTPEYDPVTVEAEPKNKQQGWMEDFVKRSEDLLGALLDREDIPDNGMCRGCMRLSHRANPLHNIERWTGKFFRAAALWEVGGYVLISHRHQVNTGDCLKHRQDILEKNEQAKDEAEQTHLGHGTSILPMEAINLCLFHAETDVMDPEEGDGDLSPGGDYLGVNTPGTIPRRDDFNNDYVRIVHTNGIHHRALVTCGCMGAENIHTDLMYWRYVPTTFSKYRMLFTTAVLDDYRLANLECKVSAYQYMQKLRHKTSPLLPASAPNLYQELLRLSRLWRWIKKKKWAGHGMTPDGDSDGAPGGLAIFCPACPQPGINLPKDWKNDPNRWVYRRFFVADGNFKADHVRHKYTSDIWLSEGAGMFGLRSEYHAFLERAATGTEVR